MTPADQLRHRAELGIEPVQPIDPGPLNYMQARNEERLRRWIRRWNWHQMGERLKRLGRALRGLPDDGEPIE